MQDWGSLHPVIVHIPLGLLFIVPLLLLAGLFSRQSPKTFYQSALIVALTGTLGIYLAISSGELASEQVKPDPEVVSTLEAHEKLAGKVKLNYSLLTALLLVYVLLFHKLTQNFAPKYHRGAVALYLLLYMYSLVLLLNTAHQGGKLVHHHNVTSKIYTSSNLTDKN